MPAETLVFIPPMLCDARVCYDQITALAQDHAVMVLPTHRGERMEEIASQALGWAPSKFAVAGLGMGGMVAMEILRRAPERVTRVALVGTSPLPDTPEEAAAREAQIVAAQAGRFEDVMQHEINSTWLAATSDKVGIVQLLRDMGRDLGAAAYVRQSRALQRRRDQQATMRKISQPAMVLCGKADGQYPLRRHEFLSELIPYATFEVLDRAGYLPTLEAPEAATDAAAMDGRTIGPALTVRAYAAASFLLAGLAMPALRSIKSSTNGRMLLRQLPPAKIP